MASFIYRMESKTEKKMMKRTKNKNLLALKKRP